MTNPLVNTYIHFLLEYIKEKVEINEFIREKLDMLIGEVDVHDTYIPWDVQRALPPSEHKVFRKLLYVLNEMDNAGTELAMWYSYCDKKPLPLYVKNKDWFTRHDRIAYFRYLQESGVDILTGLHKELSTLPQHKFYVPNILEYLRAYYQVTDDMMNGIEGRMLMYFLHKGTIPTALKLRYIFDHSKEHTEDPVLYNAMQNNADGTYIDKACFNIMKCGGAIIDGMTKRQPDTVRDTFFEFYNRTGRIKLGW